MGSVVADLFYANEKFSRTVDQMASTEGSLRERLVSAYSEHAVWANPPEGGAGPPIDDGLKERIVELHHKLTAATDWGSDGKLAVTVSGIDDEELAEVVKEVIAIAHELRRDLDQHMSDIQRS